jgi:hypothetical protein
VVASADDLEAIADGVEATNDGIEATTDKAEGKINKYRRGDRPVAPTTIFHGRAASPPRFDNILPARMGLK